MLRIKHIRGCDFALCLFSCKENPSTHQGQEPLQNTLKTTSKCSLYARPWRGHFIFLYVEKKHKSGRKGREKPELSQHISS